MVFNIEKFTDELHPLSNEVEVLADTPFTSLLEFKYVDGEQLIEFGICHHHEFWVNDGSPTAKFSMTRCFHSSYDSEDVLCGSMNGSGIKELNHMLARFPQSIQIV
jgi:hypothetical protein